MKPDLIIPRWPAAARNEAIDEAIRVAERAVSAKPTLANHARLFEYKMDLEEVREGGFWWG